MKAIVISQPMFFPWVGMFEQIRLADVYIHYDDAQFSKGSFTNRVQIKTAKGSHWLTVPLRDLKLGQRIMDVVLDERQDWRKRHLTLLGQAYGQAPFRDEMLSLVKEVYAKPAATISELAIASMEALRAYYAFPKPEQIVCSSQLGIGGSGSARVLDMVKRLNGTVYITGHGARNYLEHELFERQDVRVEYMDYQKLAYPQLHGEFTPFVSTLDLVANAGRKGTGVFVSGTVYWKQFLI
jgi:hypothetical protein